MSSIPESKILDVREIPCSVKHQQIFDRFLSLPAGDFFVLRNGHDPVPLRNQFESILPGGFSWEYLQAGPEVFEIKISKLSAQVASGDFKAAGNCCCDQ